MFRTNSRIAEVVARISGTTRLWVIDSIGRAAEPLDIANVVQYLATGPSAYVNGRDLIVDGGFTAGLTMGWIDKNESPLVKARAARS